MQTADVVIIGGGVIGASVAYHLAARGVGDVLVLERGAGPGVGSTGRATGGFRAQFGTRVNVRLSLLSREKLLRFEEETGVDPGFRQVDTSSSRTARGSLRSWSRRRPSSASAALRRRAR